jgi:hypothetical protein
MKRITITVPDELASLIQQERQRRDVSAATIVRNALEEYLLPGDRSHRRPPTTHGRRGSDGTSKHIPEATRSGRPHRIASPRLVRREQLADFLMEVSEAEADA